MLIKNKFDYIKIYYPSHEAVPKTDVCAPSALWYEVECMGIVEVQSLDATNFQLYLPQSNLV